MNFKVKKIHTGKSNIKNKFWRFLVSILGPKGAIIFTVLMFLGGGVIGINALVQSDFFKESVRRTGSFNLLETDKSGHTNILLLGVAGKNEEGGHLSDSIMLVSINPRVPSVSFMSLPRDLFVGSDIGDRKVNEIYAAAQFKHGEKKGLKIIEKAIGNFAGIDIQYGAVVSFSVFEDVVDTLGGIEIFVPKEIVDPFYPDVDYGYQTFVVRKGLQQMDGAMALKYARSRKTSSDYDRAQRQQDLILALREKASDTALLTDFEKLKTFYNNFQDNVNTDLGITEMIGLAKLAVSIDYKSAISSVLNDDPSKKGGFLYTPAREFYGGQFVLLPRDLKDTQKFIELVLLKPEILLEKAQIEVLNGSKISGLASETASRLRRFGFHIIEVGNYESDRPVFKTYLEDLSDGKKKLTKKFLTTLFLARPAPQKTTETTTNTSDATSLTDLRVILGTN